MLRRPLLLAALVAAATASVALAVPGPVQTYFLEENLHPVVPGVYRSAQPSAEELDSMIRTLGLRTVLNLRGELGGRAWLAAERRVSAAHGVEHESIHLNADRMPPAQRLRAVVRALDSAPRPLLFHCQGGVERSGLVAAVAVLLAGGDLAAARRQFAVRKGYVPFLSRSDLPQVLDDYERWLAARGEAHTPDRFRDWVAHDYAPYFYRARLELVDGPGVAAIGHARTLRVRVTNESRQTIPFRASRSHGVHLGAWLRPPPGDASAPIELRGRPVDLDLVPGAVTELGISLPALRAAGRWSLQLDLVDEGVKWFAAMGSQPLTVALPVRTEVADGAD